MSSDYCMAYVKRLFANAVDSDDDELKQQF